MVKLVNNVAEVMLEIEIASFSLLSRKGGNTTWLDIGKEVSEVWDDVIEVNVESLDGAIGLAF